MLTNRCTMPTCKNTLLIKRHESVLNVRGAKSAPQRIKSRLVGSLMLTPLNTANANNAAFTQISSAVIHHTRRGSLIKYSFILSTIPFRRLATVGGFDLLYFIPRMMIKSFSIKFLALMKAYDRIATIVCLMRFI